MVTISKQLKEEALKALQKLRENFDGTDAAFAEQWSINGTVYNRLKKGEIDGLLKEATWINICRELNIGIDTKKWVTVRTDVYTKIEQGILFCKQHSKSMIFVDECEIGKTYTAKHLSRTQKNCFYIDASQCKVRRKFILKFAQAVGVDGTGTYEEVKENIKYCLKLFPQPIVIIDEAGDLEYNAFLELKEFWNATEGVCGWYLMGADGLQKKIDLGIKNKKVGYREMFSRFSGNYTSVLPPGKDDRITFYMKMLTEVATANAEKNADLKTIVRQCLKEDNFRTGGLRRLQSVLILNTTNNG